MPYPNFHAARLVAPKEGAESGTQTLPDGILRIAQKDEKGEWVTQAFRFPKDKFSVQQAKDWLAEHKVKYILFEPASGGEEGKQESVMIGMADWTETALLESVMEGASVDREKKVLRGIVILGSKSKNGYRYPKGSMPKWTTLYEGKKVFLNHRKRGEEGVRDVRDFVGKLTGVRFAEEDGKLRADLKLAPSHAEMMLSLAESMPDAVGMSHDASGKMDWTSMEVKELTRVNEVDVVTDAATTTSLFESVGAFKPEQEKEIMAVDWKELNVDALREHRPDLIKVLMDGAKAEMRPLVEENQALKKAAADRERRDKLSAVLKDSGIPKEAMTETFIESVLRVADDDKAVKALIEDRKKFCAAPRGGGNDEPKSKSVDPLDLLLESNDSGKGDAKDWPDEKVARLVRG